MDFAHALLTNYSKTQAERIALYIGPDQGRFDELLACMLGDDPLLSQRAAWPIGKVLDAYAWHLLPHLATLREHLQTDHIHPAIPRNILRGLTFLSIPEDEQGEWLDLCFGYLQDPKQPVAIRVHAMQVAFNLSQPYPELQQELHMIITAHVSEGSAGFKSRAKKLLKNLAS